MKSAPLWRRVMPRASVSFPGPLARSSIPRAPGLRRRMRGIPSSGSSGADQDASRAALRLGDHVQALVHAVDEVHVGVAGLAEHHASAGSDAAPGMRCAILKAQVGFRFDDVGRRWSRAPGPFPAALARPRSQADCRTRAEAARTRCRQAAYISTLPLNTMSFSLNLCLTAVLSNLLENSISLSSAVNVRGFGEQETHRSRCRVRR